MQIHELNEYKGDIEKGMLALDDGNDTGKLSVENLLDGMNKTIDQVEEELGDRINNIIAGGTAPSAAEVTDARLGASVLGGKTYQSLGDSIRGQATALYDEISAIGNETYKDVLIKWERGAISPTGENDDSGTYPQTHYRTIEYFKESELYKLQNPDSEEIYMFKYTFDGTSYAHTTTVPLNLVTEYTFNPDSEEYIRLAGRLTAAQRDTIIITAFPDIVKSVSELKTKMSDVEPKVQALEEGQTINKTTDIYDPTSFTNAYLGWADGNTTAFNDGRTSDFIEVAEGNVINYMLHALGQISPVIACYDSNKDYIQAASIKGAGNGGAWTLNEGSLVIPEGVSYIRYSSNGMSLNSDSISLVKKTQLKDYIEDTIINPWDGKNWGAFGTSITNTSTPDAHFLQPTGKYVPYLTDMSGMVVTNYGISGGSILSDIMNRVLDTDVSGFDIVTVEGSVNDHATSKPLGEVGDTGTDTFAGAIYQIAKHVYENSNATLFFITDYVGRYVHINPAPDGSDFYGDCSPGKVNALGLLQIDYIDMMIKQCEYFSFPCIPAGQECGINLLTGDLYLMDHIHSSYVGGKQYAQTIWDMLKLKKPRILSV